MKKLNFIFNYLVPIIFKNYQQYYCVSHLEEILKKIAKRLLTPIWHVILLRHNNPIRDDPARL